MSDPAVPGPDGPFLGITRTVSSRLKELRGSTPEVMKAFGEFGRAATADGEKYRPWFETEIHDDDGVVVASVRKQLHVRRKQ